MDASRFLLLALLACVGCGTTCPATTPSWSAAEQLFRRDDHWIGGDAAYSIDLDHGRVLWLFGDSFVSRVGATSRSGVPFARNTIAIQHGYDPATATLDFHYRSDGGGQPSAFFTSDAPGTWMWPGHGARLGDVLFLFLWRVKAIGGGLGFQNDIPEAVLIHNPDEEPEKWVITSVPVPINPWGIFLGTGAVVVEDGYLISLSCVEPGNHDVYAARWPIDAVARGRLDDPEWAVGDRAFAHQSTLAARPLRLFAGHTEFSVHRDAATHQYIEVQATGFSGDVTMRTASALTGPWSEARTIYHPPELACSKVITYAAKVHPEQASPALAGRVALTYASNSLDFANLVTDLNLYFPRMLRLDAASGSVLEATPGPRK